VSDAASAAVGKHGGGAVQLGKSAVHCAMHTLQNMFKNGLNSAWEGYVALLDTVALAVRREQSYIRHLIRDRLENLEDDDEAEEYRRVNRMPEFIITRWLTRYQTAKWVVDNGKLLLPIVTDGEFLTGGKEKKKLSASEKKRYDEWETVAFGLRNKFFLAFCNFIVYIYKGFFLKQMEWLQSNGGFQAPDMATQVQSMKEALHIDRMADFTAEQLKDLTPQEKAKFENDMKIFLSRAQGTLKEHLDAWKELEDHGGEQSPLGYAKTS
jgi:hypothetical protein